MGYAGSNFWKGKRCLVTGGCGFGGSHLCEQLLDRGAVVFVLDQICPRNSYLVLTGLINDVEYFHGDVRDIEFLKVLLQRFEIDTVFHLAAQPIVPLSNSLPFETLSINALGTYAVLEAVHVSPSCNAMVFASTGAYYGTTTQKEPIKEDAPTLQASNIYAPSKVAGDVAVRAYAKIFNMRTAVCRFINTYGPGKTEFSTIVPRAIWNLMNDLPYDFGNRDDGTTTLDFLHVRDMARGYISVVEHLDKVSGEAINFGAGHAISVRDLVKLTSQLYDGEEREPLFHGPKRDIPLYKCLDTEKAKRLLGWQPEISLEQGLQETIEWYRQLKEKNIISLLKDGTSKPMWSPEWQPVGESVAHGGNIFQTVSNTRGFHHRE